MKRRTLGFEREWAEFSVSADALLHARLDWGVLTGIDLNKAAQVILYSIPNAGPMERIRFKIPEADYMWVDEVAAGPDGSVVAVGGCINTNGQHGSYVARISSDRQSQTIVRTWPYVAHRLAVAVDGTIWTAGWVKDPPNDLNVEFNVFKRLDSSGNVLSTFVSHGRPGPYLTPSGDATTSSHLRASRDRIGWLTNGMEYIEFGLDGRKLHQFGGPPVPQPTSGLKMSLALSLDNEVLLAVQESGMVEGKRVGKAKWSLWSLDRGRRTWFPLQVSGAPHPAQGFLLGFDGASVLVRSERRVIRSFRISGR